MDGCLQIKHKDDQILKSSKLFQISTTILHSSVMLPYLSDSKEHSQETENKWHGAALAVRVREEEESAVRKYESDADWFCKNHYNTWLCDWGTVWPDNLSVRH